ncbi:recombinase RecT [Pseudoalteromonas sp. SG41-5]|uniref:recombinase RecT n=1 Tax=Pseudoalteromonas sp. SG41-5 TaxID=2760975 RepID=UPI0015FFA533|nr:recombinase RecT [Pseudoalteromonas sp. SG41-5]MBB1469002.1 recombinase RecT [Pseudoalteromonas sp. SG41-5]
MSLSLQEYQNLLYGKLTACKGQFDAYISENGFKLDFNTELNYVYQIVMSGVNVEYSFPYTPVESVISSFLKAAKLGLSLCPNEQLCFLKTEYRESSGQYVTELALGYKGILKLAYRSGKVKQINANVFYEKDNFQYNGVNSKVTHTTTVLSKSMRGQLAGGYCQTELTDGSFKTTVMPPEEILAIEEQGKAMGNEAWLSVYVDQMREKTLIKRHWKTLCPCIYIDSVMNDPMLFDDQDCQHNSNQQAYEEQFESAYSGEAY